MTHKQAIHILKNMISNQKIMTAEMYEAFDIAIEALIDDDCQKGILTPEERSEVLNAIDDVLHGYQVMGYEDNDGMLFKVLISKVERGEAE